MAKFAAASDLFETVVENNVSKVEEYLQLGDSPLWRELIRYEFDISDISHPKLKKHHLLAKLSAYEIKTLSAFHVASLLGLNDVLMALMEKDIPIDMPTVSGTTAFHLACFSGKMDTVNLLREIYKADLTRRDRYGWSALHYASTEGHLGVVQSLIRLGLDVNDRDQDGTTAAFRAHSNKHHEVVKYLLQQGSSHDLLGIDETKKYQADDEIAALYAKSTKQVDKARTLAKPQQKNDILPDYSNFAKTHTNGKVGKTSEMEMFTSAPSELNRSISEPNQGPGFFTDKRKQSRHSITGDRPSFYTLPAKYRQDPDASAIKETTIRRMIRKELEKSFGDDCEYETPISVKNSLLEDEIDFGSYHIGKKTLTGLMRKEFELYKKELAMKQPPSHPPPPPVQNKDDTQYEDLYASLANLAGPPSSPPPPPGKPPHAPPLPPRNPSMNIYGSSDSQLANNSRALTLSSNDGSNVCLEECLAKLAPALGRNWTKLAHALPLDNTPTGVDACITQIERVYNNNVTKQALSALVEWRKRKGKGAHVDDIIIALRKCNLHPLIPVVEKVTQEFTA